MHSIVEVCKKTTLSSRTLRVWEEENLFKGKRDANGMRVFDSDIFNRIEKIKLLKEFGLSLKDIAIVLAGENTATVNSLLHARRKAVEKETVQLLEMRRKLARLEELLDCESVSGNEHEHFVKDDMLIQRFTATLFEENPFAQTATHVQFLKDELESLNSDETISWFVTLRQIVRYAREHDVPTRFVRGYGASSLSLRLAGLTNIDPCAEALVPHSPLAQDLHLDVPFTGSEHFFEFLAKINTEALKVKIVAFQLPLLDILNDFTSLTGTDAYACECDDRIVDYLRERNCENIFGIDESGESMLYRLYPELSSEVRSVAATSTDLRRFAPKNKEDVLRFLALRRASTFNDFEDYLSGKNTHSTEGAIAGLIPKANRGIVFFREELLSAIKKITGWSWQSVSDFRRKLRANSLSQVEIENFIAASDTASFDFVKQWQPLCFHRAHLVSWWQFIAITTSCNIRDSKTWQRCILNWEQKYGLKWNDFGVNYREAKLLTPF